MESAIITLTIAIPLLLCSTFATGLSDFSSYEKNSGNIEKSKMWKRVATSDPNKLWEEGVIPYEINPNCSESLQNTIHRAMEEWESKTCLKFVEAKPEHEYRIIINNEGYCGCCSSVGKDNERQLTIFHETCNTIPIIMHELGHTIGFHHEQNRPDRDNYINVLFENIKKGHEHNFNKLKESAVDTFGFGYDFKSIMHYSSNVFGIDGKESMQTKNQSTSIKNKNLVLSKTDIAVANKLYNCPKCYLKLNRKAGTIELSKNNLAIKEGYCQWFIERNAGEFVEFYVENLDFSGSESCSDDYLQFQDGYWSKSPIIGRLCGKQLKRKYYKTNSNNLLITYKSSENLETNSFSLKYRVICNGTIRADSGKIQSPKFNEPYPYDSKCEWTLVVPSGYKVALSFQNFHIDYDEDCQSDYVEILDGGSNLNKLSRRFCGNVAPADSVSSSNTMIVRFVSQSRKMRSGFLATFTKEIDECELPGKGGCTGVCINTIGSFNCECGEGKLWFYNTRRCETIVNSCGGLVEGQYRTVIVSPSFPNLYPNNTNCIWNIANENFRLQFLHMDVDNTGGYCWDKVILEGGSRKQTYCGFNIPSPKIVRQTPNFRVQFISNKKRERSGFALLVEPLI